MDQLIAHINSTFALDVDGYEKVAKGFLSENHILTSSSASAKYFLKKYRFDDIARIHEVHAVKRYFAERGLPVILPVGLFSFGGAHYALFPFIADKQLTQGELTDAAIVSLAETLAHIHIAGSDPAAPVIKETFKPWDREKALKKAAALEAEIARIPESARTDFDRLALESVVAKKRHILENAATYESLHLPSDCLIHGDYLDHNVFFDADDHVSHVFDFEKTDRSPRTYELYRSLAYAFFDAGQAVFPYNDETIRRARLYLDSYRRIYPISNDELARGLELFYLKAVHAFWVESEHYLMKNDRTDELLKEGMDRIALLAAHREELARRLF